MSRRPGRTRVLLVAAGLLTTTACGVPRDEAPRALQRGDVPFASPTPSPTPSPASEPAGAVEVPLHFVRNGQVVPTSRRVEGPLRTRALVDLLFGGTVERESKQGLISVIPSTLTVEDVEVQGGTAVLTLDGPDAEVLRTSPLAYAQIVATLVPARVQGVRFRLDGRDLDVPRGDGSLSSGPLTREDYAEVLAPPPPTLSDTSSPGAASADVASPSA